MSRRLHASVLLLTLFAGPTAAQPQAADTQPDAGLEDLMAILQEETEVATRTRMNGDFVPGMVTVLHGNDLEALGVETVWEALGLVPGMQATRGPDGIPSVVVRGIDFPFNSGNIKVLVDSVPLSRENAGLNGIVLLTPIQQVDRIEIIRGPGSVVHGDFAFMGLVNVITRARGTRAWLRGGGNEAIAGGASLSGTPGSWELSLGLAGWRSGAAPVSEPVVADEDRTFASAQARRGGLTLVGLATTRGVEPVSEPPGLTVRGGQEHWALEARYARDLRGAQAQGRASVRNNDYEAVFDFRGKVMELGLDVSGSAGKRHHWLAGAAYHRSTIDLATFRFPPPPGMTVPVEFTLRLEGERREVWSVLAQDRFDISESLAATAGVRLDHDRDIGARLTPRVALVWRASDRHILKAQYAEGFRPPTFFELYSTGRAVEGMQFEVNATSEINYVYRRPRTVLRGTLFRTRLRDMIYPTGPGVFGNSRAAHADGAELEAEQQVGGRLRLIGNLSFVDEEDSRNATSTLTRTPPAARWMANAAAIFRPTARTAVTARWNHVGERRIPEPLDGWDLLDLSGAVEGLGHRGLVLRGGVKNLLDSDVRYAVALPRRVDVSQFPGRTFWVQLTWERP